MNTEIYTVNGMTCDHCARSVDAEVSAIPGVTEVQVDLASGRLTVTSQEPLAAPQVRDAVAEAGYTLGF